MPATLAHIFICMCVYINCTHPLHAGMRLNVNRAKLRDCRTLNSERAEVPEPTNGVVKEGGWVFISVLILSLSEQ